MNNTNIFLDRSVPTETLQKTLEKMQAEKRELEQQRLATLNVLQDMHKAQEELAKKYKYIQNIRELLEKLTISSDFISVTQAAFGCFQKTIKNSYVVFLRNDTAYIFSDFALPLDYQKNVTLAFSRLLEVLKNDEEKQWVFDEMNVQNLDFKIVKVGVSNAPIDGRESPIYFPIVIKSQEKNKSEVLGLIYINRIITEKVNIEEQDEAINDILNLIAINLERINVLDVSEHSKFNDFVQSMTDGVLMFDIDKKIILTNSLLQKIAGLTNLSNLESFAKLFEGIDLISKINEIFENEEVILIKETKFMGFDYEISITPVRDYKKKIAGGAVILHDITRLKEIDRMKTDFLSVAAHQLRTPLTGIRWSLDSLLDGDLGDISDKIQNSLKRVKDTILRMAVLVNDLLSVVKIDQGELKRQPKMTDVVELVNKLIDENKEVAESKTVTVQLIASENEKFEIFIDPEHLKIILENLLSNAITYNKKGGAVDVMVSKEDHKIKIAIKDTGIGIPQKDQVKIFSKFFRAGNAVVAKTDGSGLGLYVAKSYIESWNGKLEFTSVEGKGTTFIVTLHVVDIT